MKYILVLSQLTYVPDNCLSLLQKLSKKHQNELVGVVLLQNLSFEVVLKTLWLYVIGCSGIAGALLRNGFGLVRDERVKVCKSKGIALIQTNSMNTSAMTEWIQEQGIDCIVNNRTRCIYKEAILQAPKLGCFNIHHGLLPKYRGMYCDIYALHEDRPAGISLHKMNRKIDDGQVLFTKEISKKGEKDFLQYLSRTGEAEAELIDTLIRLLKKGKIPTEKSNKKMPIVYTHTPSYTQIRQMQHDGMKL